MNGESELCLILTSLLTVKKIVAIGIGQELLLESLSHMIKIIILNAETEFRPR